MKENDIILYTETRIHLFLPVPLMEKYNFNATSIFLPDVVLKHFSRSVLVCFFKSHKHTQLSSALGLRFVPPPAADALMLFTM